MIGTRRIISALAIAAVLGGSLAVPGVVDPADAKNRVGRFFNKVGDAIVNNPLTKRSKRNRTRGQATGAGEPAFDLATRKLIQTRLNDLGYDVGAADGIFGNGTRRGISAFQGTIGFAPTGYLTKEQADLLLADVPRDTPATTRDAQAPAAPAAPADQPTAEIAGPEAVWNSLAMRSCTAEDVLACMERFGAPAAAVAFVRRSADAGVEPGLLAVFDDFGTVDLGEVRYPWDGKRVSLVLLNGGPAAVAADTSRLPKITLNGAVYRKLLARYGELSLIGQPRLESHRLETGGGQRFVFAYRLAKCEACATPGEILIGQDFDADGRYQGVKLLGIAARDPDLRWSETKRASAQELREDTAALQRRLAGLGFDAGALDGKGGKKLQAALAAFQADHGLKAREKIDARTARVLAGSNIDVEISRFDRLSQLAKHPDRFDLALRHGLGILSRTERQTAGKGVAFARMNSRIARLYNRSKDPASALPYAERAVSVSAAAGRQKSQIYGLYLVGLGETQLALGQRQEALGNLGTALDIFQQLAVSKKGSRRKLAAKAFQRTGKMLIEQYEKQDRLRAANDVRRRLDAMEKELAAAE